MTPRLVLCAAVLFLVTAGADTPKAPPEDLTLPTPDYLPTLARKILHQRMQRHGRDQARLVTAVTLLQRDVVVSIADDIAAEPRLVRPLSEGRDELNASLPERFFVLQDALRLRAKDLSGAAKRKDDVALGRAFGQMVEVCVSCHSSYLSRE